MYCHFSSVPNHRVKGLFHHCLLTVCRSGFTHSMARGQGLWGGSRFHHSLCSLGLHPTGQTGKVMKWLQLASVRRRAGAQDSTTVTPAFLLKHLLRSSWLGPSPNPRLPSDSGFIQGNLEEISQIGMPGPGIISLSCFCSDWLSVPVLLF